MAITATRRRTASLMIERNLRVTTVEPMVFDDDIRSFSQTCLPQALAEFGSKGSRCSSTLLALTRVTTGIVEDCARTQKRLCRHCSAKKGDNGAPLHVPP